MVRVVFIVDVGSVRVGGFFFFSSRRRHTRFDCDWSSDVCSSDLLLGGTRIVLETPSLREDRRGRRGRRRRTRGPRGAGCYPVLEALGIADRVSPATRSEIALHVVQAASYREAAARLARRGLACGVSRLVRISTATA